MAGGPITVTDRISVRVSAKNQEQSAANKKAVGGAIGKTLGNEDISDELKTQLGNTTNPVVYDEDGNAWISIDDIIAAGRKMKENGAFESDYVYEGLSENGVTYTAQHVYTTEGFRYQYTDSGERPIEDYVGTSMWSDNQVISGGYVLVFDTSLSNYCYICSQITYSPAPIMVHHALTNAGGGGSSSSNWGAKTVTINGVSYSFFAGSPFLGRGLTGAREGGIGLNQIPGSDSIENMLKTCAGVLFGPIHEVHNGPLIDWDAPNAEVERQIKELHDTWDVSEHEGAVTANGTYVLAGPIEFNDADPSLPDPEEEE